MFCVARQGQALQGAKTTEIESKPLVMWRTTCKKFKLPSIDRTLFYIEKIRYKKQDMLKNKYAHYIWNCMEIRQVMMCCSLCRSFMNKNVEDCDHFSVYFCFICVMDVKSKQQTVWFIIGTCWICLEPKPEMFFFGPREGAGDGHQKRNWGKEGRKDERIRSGERKRRRKKDNEKDEKEWNWRKGGKEGRKEGRQGGREGWA